MKKVRFSTAPASTDGEGRRFASGRGRAPRPKDDQPNKALQINSMASDDPQASVVGTDHSSI
ncbi:hypothetical protein PANO111632_01005 [Paracoccus nototheniae]